MSASLTQLFADESREFLLCVGPDGKVRETDERARRMLGVDAGDAFVRLAAPGVEAKVEELLARGRTERLDGWELALIVGGAPATVLISTAPHEGGVALHGSLVPEDFGAALQQVNDALAEIVELNRLIARQKRELQVRERQLMDRNQELSDANRGILNLHAELEDRSEAIKRASEVKSRVVANVSHEFRTPLQSILGLSRLLVDGIDGELNAEQLRQVRFIRASAEELSQLVNDLLDLSKLESGKMTLRPERFTVQDLFAGLRGALKPLLPDESPVALHFDAPEDPIPLDTDRGKLSQVMRNLIANALKFTERGEVRVVASLAGDRVHLSVQDTGVGIAPADQERVFEEFTQLDTPLHRSARGTGLGLPLVRKLVARLGGSVGLRSALGQGSTFSVELPLVHSEVREYEELAERAQTSDGRAPVLVVEDDRTAIIAYEHYLSTAGFQTLPARTVDEARVLLQKRKPAAIVLDVLLEGESTWRFLRDLKADPGSQGIPVMVVTVTNERQRARALGADEFWLKPLEQSQLLARLKVLVEGKHEAPKILVVEDDSTSRYLLRKNLEGTPYTLLEAESGEAGLRTAREHMPQLILLDLLLGEGMSGFDVLDELKANPKTRRIPVVIWSAHSLSPSERDRLSRLAQDIVPKESLSRELALQRIRDALEKAGLRQPEGR